MLKSVPRMDLPRQAKLDPVEGQPPDLTRLDEGCAFRPRCGFATAQCAKEFPPLEKIKGPHIVACWERDKVAKASGAAAKSKRMRKAS